MILRQGSCPKHEKPVCLKSFSCGGAEFERDVKIILLQHLKTIAYLLLSSSRLRPFVLSALCDSVVYSRKPPGLIFQLRLLTTESQSSQRRAIFLIPIPSNLKIQPIDSRIIVVLRRSYSVRSVPLWFYSVTQEVWLSD